MKIIFFINTGKLKYICDDTLKYIKDYPIQNKKRYIDENKIIIYVHKYYIDFCKSYSENDISEVSMYVVKKKLINPIIAFIDLTIDLKYFCS